MGAYLARRLAQAVLVMLVMSLLVFAGVYAIGNPISILIPPDANQADIAKLSASLGLDRPLWEQYWVFLKQAVSGNLGTSFAFNVPAIKLILERLPATLELAVSASLIAMLAGVPLGLWAGLKPKTASGKLITAGSILGFSLPTFWVGLVLVMVFSVLLGWLPSGGRGETRVVFGLPFSFL